MKNKIIAVIGAGGKTTLIHRLAEEYRRKGASVLVSTTTHMLVEPDTDLSCDSFAIMEKIKKTGYCMAGAVCLDNSAKMQSLPEQMLHDLMKYWKIGRCLQRLPKERARIRYSVEITENCCSRFRTAVTIILSA